MANRHYSLLDHLIMTIDTGMRTLMIAPKTMRTTPVSSKNKDELTDEDRKLSGALMRINHTGEICAQALYTGQAFAASSGELKKKLLSAAKEETDHLAWCQQRLTELNDHTSYLNPLWYMGALSIGIIAGAINDKWSLGFVVETERQVERHLTSHLEKLPANDLQSRAILNQMCQEEIQHANDAKNQGAIELPGFVKTIMKMMSGVMTTTAYYI